MTKKMLKQIEAECSYQLEKRYPAEIPGDIVDRFQQEISWLAQSKSIKEFYAYQTLCKRVVPETYSMLPSGQAAGSLMIYLMNSDCPNPLQAHYYCRKCGHFEPAEKNCFATDLPERQCPKCGSDILADGFDIDTEYTFGPEWNQDIGIGIFHRDCFVSEEEYMRAYQRNDSHRSVCDYFTEQCVKDYDVLFRYREEIYHLLVQEYQMNPADAYHLTEDIRRGKLYQGRRNEEFKQKYHVEEDVLQRFQNIAYIPSLANSIIRVLPAMKKIQIKEKEKHDREEMERKIRTRFILNASNGRTVE